MILQNTEDKKKKNIRQSSVPGDWKIRLKMEFYGMRVLQEEGTTYDNYHYNASCMALRLVRSDANSLCSSAHTSLRPNLQLSP